MAVAAWNVPLLSVAALLWFAGLYTATWLVAYVVHVAVSAEGRHCCTCDAAGAGSTANRRTGMNWNAMQTGWTGAAMNANGLVRPRTHGDTLAAGGGGGGYVRQTTGE